MRQLIEFITSLQPVQVISQYTPAGNIRRDENGNLFFSLLGYEEYRWCGNGFFFGSSPVPYSIIDVLATSVFSNYIDAVRDIVARFKDALPEHLCGSTDVIANKAELLHTRLGELFGSHIPSNQLPGSSLLAFGDVAKLRSGAYTVVAGKVLNDFRESIPLLGSKKFSPTSVYLAIPLFSNTCTLAGMMVRSERSDKYDTYYTEVADTIAYMNMYQMQVGTSVFVHKTPDKAIAACSKPENADAHTVIVPAPKLYERPFAPDRCYIISSGDPAGLVPYCELASRAQMLHITRAGSTSELPLLGSLSWSGAIADILFDAMSGGNTELFNMYVPALKRSREIQQRLIAMLKSINRFELVYTVEHMFKEGLIWSSDAKEVYKTPSGYLYEDNHTRDVGGVAITNYLIEPLHASRFEAGEIFYRCKVVSHGEEREVSLPSHAFDSARVLTEYIQNTLSLSGQAMTVIPTLFESAYARPIISWLQKQFTELPIKRGTSFLGWQADRSKFFGPDFVASEDRVAGSTPEFKPTVPHLSAFASSEGTVSKNTYNELPDPFRRVVEACAGIIARSYCNSELTPIQYKDTPSTRAALKEIFKLVGQGKLVRLNPNFRKGLELQPFQGYPVLAAGYNCHQALASKAGILLLGEQGEVIEETTDSDIASCAMCVRYVLTELPRWIIRQDGLPCVFSSEDVTSDLVIEDGKKVLDTFFPSQDS